MITKRKKNTRQRGEKTHGYGSMKKNRGAGHRGGRGNAGSGKRGDCKKPSMIKKKRQFGKRGFKSKSSKMLISINLQSIEEKADNLVKLGKAKDVGGVIVINLKDIGCDKLLGKGVVTRKYNIECVTATDGAVEAVQKAGGSVIVKEETQASEETGEPESGAGDSEGAEEGAVKAAVSETEPKTQDIKKETVVNHETSPEKEKKEGEDPAMDKQTQAEDIQESDESSSVNKE